MRIRPKPAKATIGGKTVHVVGGLPAVHRRITTEADARSLANAMAETGNYPPGMTPCETAGINGDQLIPDHCIFDDQPFCECEKYLGFVPRERCDDPDHDEALHYPSA